MIIDPITTNQTSDSGAYSGLMRRLGEMGDTLLDMSARLLPYEPLLRSGARRTV